MRSAAAPKKKSNGMTRSPCPSKTHFARCETVVEGRPTKVTWRCDHCGEHVISGEKFKPTNARIHLAANKTYGICSNLCQATDDHAEGRKQEFRNLIKKVQQKKATKARKRKQQAARLAARSDARNKKKNGNQKSTTVSKWMQVTKQTSQSRSGPSPTIFQQMP